MVLAISIILIFAATAEAQLPFQLGQPVMSGNGCPAGTSSASISPDGTAISVLFDQFGLDIFRGRHTLEMMRRNCSFHIPLYLAPGYNLEVQNIDYRGFANLPGGNRAWIVTTGPIADMSDFTVGGHQLRTQLPGGVGLFTVTQEVRHRFRNRCRPLPALELNAVIQAAGPHARGGGKIVNEDMSVYIDSMDMGGTSQDAITLNIRVSPCR